MCLFNYNLPFSFRNKTVYNELGVLHRVPMPQYCFIKNVFLLHVLNKNENIINAGYCVLSENRKN